MSALDVIRLQISNAIRHVVAGEWSIPQAVDEIVEVVDVYNKAVAKANATKGGES